MVDLKDRFLKYVSFDTQSDEMSRDFPFYRKAESVAAILGRGNEISWVNRGGDGRA